MSETTHTVVDERAPLLDNAAAQPSYGGPQSEETAEVAAVQPVKGRLAAMKVIIPMSVGLFLSAMDGTIVAASYATIGSELHQLQNTSWIVTGYLLTLTSFQPLYGKMSDIFGRRSCLIFSYAVFALGCLLCGLARNMTELIAARALSGVGGGGMSTVASIVMSDIAPLRERGTWQAMANMVWAVGQVAGAPLGGYLADTIGWRWSFILQTPLAIIAIISVTFALDLPNQDRSDFFGKLKRVDFGGAITLPASVFCLLIAMDRGGNISWSDNITIGCLVAFVVLFLVFTLVEVKLAAEPLAPQRLIINRALGASYLAHFFSSGTFMVQTFMITLYFQAVRGRTAGEAGVILIPSIAAAVAGSIIGGVTMQATGKYYWLSMGGYAISCVGAVLVPGLSGVWVYSYAGIIVGLAIGSFGVGSGITTNLTSLIANAGQADQAVVTAVSFLFRSLGTVVFLSLATTLMQDSLRHYLYERLTGEDVATIIKRVRESLTYIDELPADTRMTVIASYADAIHVAMYFTLGLCVLALISAVFIKEKPLTR